MRELFAEDVQDEWEAKIMAVVVRAFPASQMFSRGRKTFGIGEN